ncbi:hypothetical protein [Leptospira sp. GIMC2001]|uniref:hypothetical protein n=1 Tax=Leptospira sp. GIMC2001 TaxID=1513297 RepID=UPI00234A1206|nr:hypothetical protein [Leptospira sp. GIMC2001]WCL50828.1 hypothetical protein O4O04_08450 [Leptospira sp. GIMC2001]
MRILITLLTVAILFYQCKSQDTKPPKDSTNKTVLEESKPVAQEQDGFEKLPEGFINSSTFQIVVSSLKDDPSQAESEALSVAKKKAVQVMLSYPKTALSQEGKKEIKEIAESGKITTKSQPNSGRSYFVYQVQKAGIETLVKSKIR